jgi:ATP-dependent DNA helicase RecQ
MARGVLQRQTSTESGTRRPQMGHCQVSGMTRNVTTDGGGATTTKPAPARAPTLLTRIRATAREKLGLRKLRPAQEEALRAVLSGQDTLAVMPTGSGKSAIYQVAGLLTDGPTIVVSPLIALQRDQLDKVSGADMPGAAVINSHVRPADLRRAYAALAAGQLEFLFLAPEQFGNTEMLKRLKAARPSLFVVDEAHCISEWGHGFRPDYLRLGAVVDALNHPRVLALTATASPTVRDEIVSRLHMRNPSVVVRGFDRPNLWLGVQQYETEEGKRQALLDAVANAQRPGIVYVGTQKRAEAIANALTERGENAVYYHGGLGSRERSSVQDEFMNDVRGDADVIVATSAFGMGVDKPNVRFVYHYDASDSLDSYYQEIGRAGRDGKPARTVLFYRPEDLGLRRFFASGGRVSAEQVERVAAAVLRRSRPVDPETLQDEVDLSQTKLSAAIAGLQEVGALTITATGKVAPTRPAIDMREAAIAAAKARDHRRALELGRIEVVRSYAERTSCRRRFLLNYFGEEKGDDCANCDNCEAGRDRRVRARTFAKGSWVRHPEWGKGLVKSTAGGFIVVLFDEAGEKRLSRTVVRDRGLLQPLS